MPSDVVTNGSKLSLFVSNIVMLSVVVPNVVMLSVVLNVVNAECR